MLAEIIVANFESARIVSSSIILDTFWVQYHNYSEAVNAVLMACLWVALHGSCDCIRCRPSQLSNTPPKFVTSDHAHSVLYILMSCVVCFSIK